MMKINKSLLKASVVALAMGTVFNVSAMGTQDGDKVLASTTWQGTRAYLEGEKSNQVDVSDKNGNFLGLARYDDLTNRYEFFDAKTGETRGDAGVYFVTSDSSKRVNISETKKYFAVVDLVTLKNDIFTYKRQGKDSNDAEATVFVEHMPYKGEYKLDFSQPKPDLTHKTGLIVPASEKAGISILAATKWKGLVALDEKGNDVSQYNANYLGLARYDDMTNKYEFFKTDGTPRGDYGYYSVIDNNKRRATVSVGFKYQAVLELTELNKDKFTYRRQGKDAKGNDIWITVEHVPYTEALPLNFTH